MKSTRKFISLILVLALCLSTFSNTNVDAKGKVKLNKKKITLTIGSKYKLKLKNYKKKVRWKSSNKKVASVSKKGKVTAKKKGTAKITAIAGKKKYVCKVIVKKSKRSSNNPSTVVPSTAPAVTSATPATTPGSTPLTTPTTTPDSTPLATPTAVPSSTPVTTPAATPNSTPLTTPATTPSSTPVTTPLVTPTSTPLTTPVATPSSTPVTTPAVTPAAMQDIPKFIGFKTYDDKELVTEDSELTTLSTNEMLALGTPQTETAVTDTKSIENNLINKKEMLLVKLSYENKKRDNIVEIVLNDSDYGKKQIYTTAASVNKILSSDTYYDEEKDSYITDVLLQMPVTKSESKRIIEVEETCFLRETVGVKGYADLSSTRQTTVTFLVSEEPLPSYPQYFNFTKNEEGGYTVVSLTNDFEIPETIYIPEEYKGLPVNTIGNQAFEKATFSKLIVPPSISMIGTNAVLNALNLKEVVMLCKDIPKGGVLGCKKIVVPKEKMLDYACNDTWKSYVNCLYFKDENGNYNSIYTVDFPSITIAEYNEAIMTYGQKLYRDNVIWDEENHTVSFDCKERYNSGIVFNMDAKKRQGVDLSSYRYIKCDIETDHQLMVKLFSSSVYCKMGSYESAIFENGSSKNWKGRRTIYLPLEGASSLNSIEGLLIAPNEKNAHIKVYSIEFVTKRDDLKELPACAYNEIFPKVTISENNEALATYNDDTERENVVWDEENHTVEYTVPEDGTGLMLNLDSTNREAKDLSSYNYVKCVVEVETDVAEATFDLKLHTFSESTDFSKYSATSCHVTDADTLTGQAAIYFSLPILAKKDLMQSISLSVGECISGSDLTTHYGGKLKIHSIEFVTEKPEE